jgi:hypothetical protein
MAATRDAKAGTASNNDGLYLRPGANPEQLSLA